MRGPVSPLYDASQGGRAGTLPLVNERYWQERLEQGGPCWSESPALNWEHGIISRHAMRRVFPRDLGVVIDVGCGDGRFSQWMRDKFDVFVVGVDALEWPGIRGRVPFLQCDAEAIGEDREVCALKPDVVVFMNSLTCMADWRQAVASAVKLAPRVLAFDNFQDPTPSYWRDLPHRKPIPFGELVGEFKKLGFEVEKAVAADVFHRRLFLRTPRWLHGPVALLTAAMDLVAAHTVTPMEARHSAVLFRSAQRRSDGNQHRA